MISKQIQAGKKIYFASDFHLGTPNHANSREREDKIITWLESIKHDAEILFLVGDVFDFWFEYRHVIPKGFIRFQGKLAELSDSGTKIILFGGNHDMWLGDYFTKELNIEVRREPTSYHFNGKTFLVGHGDGLGKGDYFYKILKQIFEGRLPRFLFGRILHPNLGMALAQTWAKKSWNKHPKDGSQEKFTPETDWIFKYCQNIEQHTHHNFYIFGHQHYIADFQLNADSRYINLGDWISLNSYAVFDGEKLDYKLVKL